MFKLRQGNILKHTIPLILLFNGLLSFGQTEITSIQFEGIKKYKANFLKQYINTKKGDVLDSTLLAEDVQNLLNLRGINQCEFHIDSDSNQNSIIIKAHENLTVLPLFNFGTIEDNQWFRVGAVDVNFLGREIYLGGYYQYNGQNSLILKNRIPFIKGNKWGALANLTIWRDVEPIFFNYEPVQYNYENLAVEGGVIRHFNRYQKLDFSVSYFKESYIKDPNETLIEAPDTNNKEQLVFKLVARTTKLNYNAQYVTGYSNMLNLQSLFSIGDNEPYYIAFNETRYFTHFKKSNIGFRLKLGLSTNTTDPFAPFVLDSYVNIRGVGNKIDRGTGVITLNNEWRQTVAETNFGAIQLVAFADIGAWRKPGGDFSNFTHPDHIRIFSGGGIRFSYKHAYGAVLRIDYGVDLSDTSNGGFVVGIGQFF